MRKLDPQSAMIPLQEALGIVLRSARTLDAERVKIEHALGRILAQDVVSDIDMPPFNKSAMDGYACRQADLNNELTVVETIPVSHAPKKRIGEDQCAKIMTGAMLPDGADCVIKIEDTESLADNSVRFIGKTTRINICPRGEDIRAGDIVLGRGDMILSQHIAVLATVGCVTPLVACRPKVGIIATGNELVAPSDKPGTGRIRNSNGYQLFAQAVSAGAAPRYYGIAKDTEQSIADALCRASAESDVVLLSGGVSMGDYDFVPGVLKSNGFELLFQKVRIKPGMPTVFGVSDKGWCFGLPGNPIAAFVAFELLAKPFLYKMMGHDWQPLRVRMPLEKAVLRKRTERESWLPARITEKGTVETLEYHGPAHVNTLCAAHGLISVPVGAAEIPAGSLVDMRLTGNG